MLLTTGAALAAGAIACLSLLLAMAGWGKLRCPGAAEGAFAAVGVAWPRHVVALAAVAELAVASAGLVLPGPVAGALLGGVFACLAAGAAVARRRAPGVACGCFGDDTTPLHLRHVAADAVAATAAAAAAGAGAPSVLDIVARWPGTAAAVLAAGWVGACALRWWLRGGGVTALDRSATALVDSSARVVESRLSRRSLLVRVAVAGSALATAPLRYMLYPVSAMAVVVPSDCGSGLCTDGYTAFCCEINRGLNTCPTGTFAGGWWMCTDYRGGQLCEGSGVRYYVDCNALPGTPFPGGCRCAGDHCGQRRVACNVFRYGQCNTQIAGTTVVVCRMVTCESPASIPELHCSASPAVDDAVCGHEAPCLQPMAVQLPGAGGA